MSEEAVLTLMPLVFMAICVVCMLDPNRRRIEPTRHQCVQNFCANCGDIVRGSICVCVKRKEIIDCNIQARILEHETEQYQAMQKIENNPFRRNAR